MSTPDPSGVAALAIVQQLLIALMASGNPDAETLLTAVNTAAKMLKDSHPAAAARANAVLAVVEAHQPEG